MTKTASRQNGGKSVNAIVRTVLIFLIFFSSCSKKHTPQGLRIISLSPAVTEILYAIGAQDYIAGVTEYSDWPPDARRKEKVGDFSNPSLEKIASLKPTLILAAGVGQGKALRRLKGAGYDVKIYQPENLLELFSQIKEIGALTGRESQADKLVSGMRKEIKSIPKSAGKSVFIEVCSRPLIAAGADSFLSSVCRQMGLTNVCGFSQSYPQVSVEWLIRKKPDIIILTETGSREFLAMYPFFSKANIISGIDPDILVRPGPRIVQGMWELAWHISKKEKNNPGKK